MTGWVLRRVGRLGRLVFHLGLQCLGAAGSSLWSVPPPPMSADDRTALRDRQVLAFDPAELDSWIEQVLNEADPRD